MSRVSWTRRLAAACAALALASTLLVPAPSVAEPEPRSEASSQEIEPTGPARVAVVPNAPKRTAESLVVSRRSFATPAVREPAAPHLRSVSGGGDPPALLRWRIAHGTSTSSP